ncbi:heterogeneous nuclear ribonucleoprotein A3 homolog 2 [Drosophila takahashii]|uniref:heterogeneous nuclear ribonucleoprotein A3 homolog 2 n=1 Tax=Drosophila takahashii TaxID=29030 RepID=UPI001CF9103B|nr:shematrin-like protein 1 [Drosophila takahashii]
MRARDSFLTILILLFTCCLDWSSALFFKSWKSGKGYSGAQNYGSNGYGNYGYGYGNYAGGYGYNYPAYPAYSSYSYPSYSSHSSHSYPNGGRKPSGNRQGRTYSQIAKVINPAPYVGPGGSRFLPRTPYSPLWG